MEQEEIAQEQKPSCLIVRIFCYQFAQCKERVFVQLLGVSDEFGNVDVHEI